MWSKWVCLNMGDSPKGRFLWGTMKFWTIGFVEFLTFRRPHIDSWENIAHLAIGSRWPLPTESQTYAAAWSSTGLFSATLRFFVAGPSLSQGHPSWTRSSSYPSHLQLQWGAQPSHVGGCVGTPILCLALTKTTNYTWCVGSPTL